jgi:Acyclic terpene utilisation family protein AtuA
MNAMTMKRSSPRSALRIGCASGFWGDSEVGAIQLVCNGQIDYLVFDYLAEITMSLLARARAKSPELGYAPDFVKVIAQLAPKIQAQGIRVIANAGGVNPQACAKALRHALESQGISMPIGVVMGDDLLGDLESWKKRGVREMFTGEPMPGALLSMNAYLGAQPIVAALEAGAQIVITGRVVDSAVTLAPLVHEFGWAWNSWDQLATGSLAGHIIECGTQCTGGLFTDWERVPGWDCMGFPIAECDADGRSLVITKPEQTGGLIEPATVAEQILYEIGDPKRYLLPDVTCDFSQVKLASEGPDRVRVTGARGTPAPVDYKVSATYPDGWRLMGTLMIGGHQAAAKAQRVGDAILTRCSRMFKEKGWSDFTQTSLECLGAEATYGPHARTAHSREVILKVAAKHPQKDALEWMAREIAPSATSMAQGITGFAAGRPSPSPVVRLFSCLVPKSEVSIQVQVDDRPVPMPGQAMASATMAPGSDDPDPAQVNGSGVSTPAIEEPAQQVPLLKLAHGRSGDKGDSANVGILARSPQAYEFLKSHLTAPVVRAYFAHLVRGDVIRYELPAMGALNFVMHQALDGGGVASLRYDPQGKAYAQMLLDLEMRVPLHVLESLPCPIS